MNTLFDSTALSIQFTSCTFLAGIISVIQLIHYPGFAFIHKEKFSEFHLRHTNALGFIAGPSMCLELISAVWLAKSGNTFFILNLLGVIILWLLTFLVSVPAHNYLRSGFDEKAWRRLVSTNWIRTIIWNLRAIAFSISFVFLNRMTL